MATKLTVVVSQGQSASPIKRKLEEDIVAGLLFERGMEVTVIPHLYDLAPDGTGMLCLQSIPGDMVVLSWLYPRAAHWTLDRNNILGRVGTTLLLSDEDEDDELGEDVAEDDKQRVADGRTMPNRTIHCIDLRARSEPAAFMDEVRRIAAETSVQTVGIDLMGWIKGNPKPEQLDRYLHQPGGNGNNVPTAITDADAAALTKSPDLTSTPSVTEIASPVRIDEPTARRWYPVIDYSRCTNCLECLDFCLFGVYGISTAEAILVEQPDNCRKGCPACSRVCPENAIIFPQHKSPAIAGSANGEAGGLKIDLSKLFGAPDPLQMAVLERDVELVAAGKDAVGMSVGIPKRQDSLADGPKDDLDRLMDQLDDLGF
jgi:NAD-dependent dihydropyrimidine dehydrogenase PreA subunit